jgi:hypothetical protein
VPRAAPPTLTLMGIGPHIMPGPEAPHRWPLMLQGLALLLAGHVDRHQGSQSGGLHGPQQLLRLHPPPRGPLLVLALSISLASAGRMGSEGGGVAVAKLPPPRCYARE